MQNEQRDWVEQTRSLAASFAGRRSKTDRDGGFVQQNYDELKTAGFFAAGVPTELGGGGASHREVCEIVRELAHHCGSTALAFSMHQHLVAAAVFKHLHGQPAEALLRAVAAKNLVLVSTGAGDWLRSNGKCERVEGGFRVTGRKAFCSGSPSGDLLITSAQWLDPEQGEVVLHFSVPFASEGVRVDTDWDTLGMRGTGSQTVMLEHVFVPDERITLKRDRNTWHPVWSLVLTVAVPIFMAPYIGIAEAARAIALQQVAARPQGAHTPQLVGEMDNALTLARLAWRESIANANNYAFTPSIDLANAALTCKTLVAQGSIQAVNKAMELAGGAGLFRKLGLEQLFRDVQGAAYHPLPEKQQHIFSGLLAMGLDPAG